MSRRPGLVALVALLTALISAAGAMPVAAGDTRIVFIGTTENRVLDISQPVSTGGLALSGATMANLGKQNLTKATLAIGTAPAPALPSGMTIAALGGPDAGACTVAGDARSAVCDFDSLRRNEARTISLLFSFSESLSAAAVRIAAKVNENVNDNGANQDTFFADATIDVSATTCGNVATFVPPGQASKIGTDLAGCTDQSTVLAIPGTGNGHLVRVAEEGLAACAFGLACFGDASVAQVDGGAAVTPYLEWTVSWPASVAPKINANQAGVIHFLDDGTIVQLSAKKNELCKNANATNCIVSFGYTADGAWLVAVFRTPTNGSVRGFG
jgi:hypothetical protein